MDVFTALAVPTRRGIVEMLAGKGALSASDISAQFKVSASAISQHLKILLGARLVKMEKRAQQRIYEINPEALSELELWTRRLAAQWEERFEALDAVLEREKAKLLTTKRRKKS